MKPASSGFSGTTSLSAARTASAAAQAPSHQASVTFTDWAPCRAITSANPVRWFLNVGAEGTSPLPGRSADSGGAGYYYLGTSSVLRQALGPVAPSGNEQGFELYYSAAITRWITMTADIQTVDPALFGSRSAFLLGLRAKLDF
jgi:hypothetical protein